MSAMRDPKRIAGILILIEQVWIRHPDLRLGQILDNAKVLGGMPVTDTFYVEDDIIVKGLKKLLEMP